MAARKMAVAGVVADVAEDNAALAVAVVDDLRHWILERWLRIPRRRARV